MFQKAIVLEVKTEYALILTDEGAVRRIKLKNGLETGQKIYVLPEDIFIKKPAGKIKIYLKRAAAAAAVIILCLSVFLTSVVPSSAAYAAVSFDSDKSIQLIVNRKNIIKKAESYNSSLKKATLDSFIGKQLEAVCDYILELIRNDGDTVLVACAPVKDGEKIEKDSPLWKFIESFSSDDSTIKVSGSCEDIENAVTSEQSLGIYLMENAITEDDFEDMIDDMPEEKFFSLIKDMPALIADKGFIESIKEAPELHRELLEEILDRAEDIKEDIKDDIKDQHEADEEASEKAEEEAEEAAEASEEAAEEAAEASEEAAEASSEAEEEAAEKEKEASEKAAEAAGDDDDSDDDSDDDDDDD